MSIQSPLSLAEIDERINFDALYQQALAEVQRLAGKVWTDKGEHDPGVTLLQALAYAVSDVGYRHSLPLVDMLTPQDQGEQSGIFIEGFGPDRALTCGPVTEDDFRRGLLDLHTVDGTPGSDTGFLFRNVQLHRDTAQDQFEYYYEPGTKKMLFKKPGADAGDYQTLRVAGTYRLYVEPSDAVSRAEAEPVLEEWLQNNRNLCEAVREVVWVAPQDADIHMIVDLEDDCTDPARVMAQIYEAGKALVSPQASHIPLAQMHELGFTNDEVFQGPRLKHGWMTRMPPELDYPTAQSLTIEALAAVVLQIDGVAAIRHLGASAAQPPVWTLQRGAGTYIRLWGADPFSRLANAAVVKLFKRGQQVSLTAEEVKAKLKAEPRYDDSQVVVPFGRWRKPAKYYWAGQRLPACYGLHEETPIVQEIQLHQFLLPFEQGLVDACSLLAQLPDLLSFERRGDNLVWGEYRWPFDLETVPDQVHRPYKPALHDYAEPLHHSAEKELAIVDYLLSYFGENRADRTLSLSPAGAEDYLQVQQGYLRHITDINYSRASLRIDSVSALQQRIAARLGFGAQLFDEPVDMGRLPFYLIEHRALLPAKPDPAYDTPQQVSTATGTDVSPWLLTLRSTGVQLLKVGQLIDITVPATGNNSAVTLKQVMISRVLNNAFEVRAEDHQQLQTNFMRIVEAPANTVTWKNSVEWLSDMSFRLIYGNQLGVPDGSKRLTIEPYPLEIAVDDKIVIALRSELGGAREAGAGVFADVQAVVTHIEPLQGSIVVAPQGADTLPTDFAKYSWYILRDEIPDAFSFTLSAIFRRATLKDANEPELQAAWFEEVVRAEVPAHITVHMHWLEDNAFDDFAINYAAWQNNLQALGDRAYQLLEALSIGLTPAGNYGIGARYVATQAQSDAPWDEAFISSEELFYVPAD